LLSVIKSKFCQLLHIDIDINTKQTLSWTHCQVWTY